MKSGFTFRGQEIILSKTRGRPFGGLIAKGLKKGIYPEEMRIKAATLFALTGNFKQVSELAKVPITTLKVWRKQEWFQRLLEEIQDENKETLDAKFEATVQTASDLILDRLKNGDFQVHPKTGELIRKPVNLRDIAIVQAIVIDKRNLLRGLPTSRTESVNKQVDKLAELTEFFSQLANRKRPVVETKKEEEPQTITRINDHANV